ncbi:MAG TPA: hypothetical protein VGN61_13240, partial [Verrucomicrobiae bacterium]
PGRRQPARTHHPPTPLALIFPLFLECSCLLRNYVGIHLCMIIGQFGLLKLPGRSKASPLINQGSVKPPSNHPKYTQPVIRLTVTNPATPPAPFPGHTKSSLIKVNKGSFSFVIFVPFVLFVLKLNRTKSNPIDPLSNQSRFRSTLAEITQKNSQPVTRLNLTNTTNPPAPLPSQTKSSLIKVNKGTFPSRASFFSFPWCKMPSVQPRAILTLFPRPLIVSK